LEAAANFLGRRGGTSFDSGRYRSLKTGTGRGARIKANAPPPRLRRRARSRGAGHDTGAAKLNL